MCMMMSMATDATIYVSTGPKNTNTSIGEKKNEEKRRAQRPPHRHMEEANRWEMVNGVVQYIQESNVDYYVAKIAAVDVCVAARTTANVLAIVRYEKLVICNTHIQTHWDENVRLRDRNGRVLFTYSATPSLKQLFAIEIVCVCVFRRSTPTYADCKRGMNDIWGRGGIVILTQFIRSLSWAQSTTWPVWENISSDR